MGADPNEGGHGRLVLLGANANSLYVPAIAVAEIEQGIRKLQRAGGAERAARLSAWPDSLIPVSGHAS